MKVFPAMVQKSEEWENARRTRPTASNFKKIITAKKGDMSTTAKSYAAALAMQAHFLTDPDAHRRWMGNKNTEAGNELEPGAREAFMLHTGLTVVEVGFISEDAEWFGGSPDGLIVNDSGEYIGGVEIKCPTAETLADWLMDGGLPDEHKAQCHASLFISQLPVWHFFAWNPSVPVVLHIIIKPDHFTAALTKAANDFRILYTKTRQKLDPMIKAAKAKLQLPKPEAA